MSFTGQGVVVSGGGSGIGQEVCLLAAEQGAQVAVVDIDLDKAQATVEQILVAGGAAFAYELDVTVPADVSACMDQAAADLERLDVLVNSAGVREIVSVLDLPFEEWQRVIDVNLSGTFLLSQAFARRLVREGKPGRIVNLASTLGLMAAPNRAAYTASKHAVVGLTKEMALELGDRNIRVNAVAPGVVRTPLTESYFEDPKYADLLRDLSAVGRWAEPEEIARAILFLAAEENGFITGATLPVDGGWTIGRRM